MDKQKQYEKQKVGPQVNRSVSIRKSQDDFLRVNNLNLSRIVRDAIDALMTDKTST